MKTSAPRYLVLAGVCALAFAGTPVTGQPSAAKCAKTCSGTTSLFQYSAGKSYNYQYETETKVKLAGVSQNEASVKIEANVQISVIAPCEFSIKLSQVKITGPKTADLGSDWTQELQKHVTRFSFDDGNVGEICPKDEEPTWSVNIKRAILSAFQNAQAGRNDSIETYEEDISGRCPTTFDIKDEGDAKVISKTKNLVSCFNRWGNHTAARFVQYEIRSAIQGNPAVDSKQTCNQTVRRGILADAVCQEKHILKRFNNGDKGGIIGTASQKLQFVNENGNVAAGEVGHPEKLYFDHKELELADSKQALQDAKQNLKDLCKTNQDGVRPETPGLFNELVYNLRKLSIADLKTLYQESVQHGGCPHASDCFLNALPMCGDTACVSLLADILKTDYNRLTYIQTRVYFTSLALIPHVTKEMIVAVTPLIDVVPKEGLLGISSLCGCYCRENPSCGDEAEVKGVVQKLSAALGTKCEAAKDEARDSVVYTLKALGNIGHSLEGVDKRVNCLKEKTNPSEIRLAAIHSLRRTPCSARVAPLKERFADVDEDIEVRLSAFLGFIQCATPELVKQVKEILEKEEIHQVGSFVVTYFSQVGSSSDPCKQEIQNLLSSEYISKKFNTDARKYSRFYETSQFSNQWNVGGHAEHALIFTPEGYLPRQALINLTLDTFGSSLNLLEIGGRVEGLETLLDKLFGPNGYFTNPTGFYFKEHSKQHKNPRVVELQDKYGKGIKKHPDLDLSMYMRIFGDEIAYKSVQNLNLMNSYTQIMQKIMSSLQSGQEANVKLVRANQLINQYVSIPTISGIPLHLGANATIAINVELSGKVDLSQLIRTKNAQIHASLKPSAAIERAFIFAVHVGHSKFGVRLQERIHSSTAANIAAEIKNGELFKSSIELPKQKNEILQYDLKLFTIKNNIPVEEPGIVNGRVAGELCTPERLNKWIGFKVCHEAAFANASNVPDAPYFPLTGPVRYAVTLEKTDPNLKSYEFTATWKNTPQSKTTKFLFNTPGSSIDREVSLDYDYQRGKSLAVNFKSPLKKINSLGTLEIAGPKQTGRLQIKVDDSKEYTLTGSQEVQQTGADRRVTYKGEITRPGQQPITISALDTFQMPPNGFFKRTFDLNAANLYDTPVEFKSVVERTGQREGKFDYSLKSPKVEGKISGKISLEGTVGPAGAFRLQPGSSKTEFDWSMEYFRPNVDPKPHKVDLSYNLTYTKEQSIVKFDESFAIKCNRYPEYNVDWNIKVETGPQQVQVQAQAKSGSGKEFGFTLASTRNPAENKVTGTAALKSTTLGFDHKAEFSHQNNWPASFASSVKLDTPQMKDIRGELKLTRGAGTEGEAKISYPGRDIRLFKKVEPVGPNKAKSQVIVQWSKGKQIQVDSDITYDARANDYELKSVATGINENTWTLHKKLKIDGGGSSIQSSAMLKSGQSTVYDWKFDLTMESPGKQQLQAQYRTDFNGMTADLSVDGTVEDIGHSRKLNFVTKKDKKDLVKGELIVPNIYKRESAKQLKLDLAWSQNTLLFDHLVSFPGPDQVHADTTFKLGTPPINRKLSVKINKGDFKSANITLLKDDKPFVDTNFGYFRDNAAPGLHAGFDGALQTFEPFPKRHVTAAGLLRAQQGTVEFSVNAENLLEKRRVGVRYVRQVVSGSQQTCEIEMYFNDRYVKSKNALEVQPSFGKLNGEIEYSNDGPKKIVHEYSWKLGPQKTFAAKLQTPYASLSELDGRIECSQQGNQGNHVLDLKWNQNQNFKVQVKDVLSPEMTTIDASVQSTLAGLKTGHLTVKADLQAGREFDALLDWNEANKVRLHHKRTSQPSGDESWSAGLESTLPAANCKALANADWNANTGKYKASTESQLNGAGAYKVQAAFDARSLDGTVDVSTPAEQLKNMKAQVKKLSDSEYELTVTKDAQTLADVKATLQLETNKQKLALEVKSIQKPFKTQFEREWAPNRFVLGGEFNPEPQDPKKAYGVKIISESPNPSGCDVKASLSYPARQLGLHYKRASPPGALFDASLELQSNSNEPGTKIRTFLQQATGAPSVVYGIHITKEKLADIQLEATVNAQVAPGGSKYSGDLTFKYSADPNKAISHKLMFNTTFVEQQRAKYSYMWISRHPATRTEAKHYGSALLGPCAPGSAECKRSLEAGIEVLDKQGQNKVYKYSYETDSVKKSTEELVTPAGKWTRLRQFDGEKMKVLLKRDDKDLFEIIGGYNRAEKSFEVEIKNAVTSEVLVHASARKPSPDTVELQLWHSVKNQKVEDISVLIALKDNSRLRSRIYVRPGFKDDFQMYLKAQWEAAIAALQGGVGAGGESPFAHLYQAHLAIREDVKTSLKPLFDHWQQQLDAIGRELGIDLSGLSNLIVSFVHAVQEARSQIFKFFVDVMSYITSSAPSETAMKVLQDVQEQVSAIVVDVNLIIHSVIESVRPLADSINGILANWRKILQDLLQNLRIGELIAYLKSLYDELMQNPFAQKIIQFLENLGIKLPDLNLESIQGAVSNVNQQVSRAASETGQQIGQQAAYWWEELLKNEDTKAIASFLQEAYNRLVWHLSRLGPSEKTQGLLQWITKEFRDLISGAAVTKYMPSIKESNAAKGIYVFEAAIPGDFKSVDEIGSKFEVRRLKQMANTITARLGAAAEKADYAVRDAMIYAHPSSFGVKVASPLSSTAILSGDQHIVTFDDEEFDFAGECEYLLARDFDNGDFTIFITFERRQNRVARKSVTVEYLTHKVEVSYDNKVKINDREGELPWQAMNDETHDVTLFVNRHDNIITVEAIDGLLVRCDSYYHVCTITVPKRYHGKSGGLLGTNDFEPFNEFIKPDRKRTTNVAEFAREWHTTPGCRVSDNQANAASAPPNSPPFEECRGFLNSSSSPLRLCFHRLPPNPFMSMCVTENNQQQQQQPGQVIQARRAGVCNAIAAYIEACDEQGVSLDFPSHCIQCELAGSVLNEGDTRRLEGDQVPNTIDIILVVEERSCMNWTRTQLPTIAQRVEADLKQQRYDVRFGLIGFNGEGVHYAPHFHTGQGELSLTGEPLRYAVAQLAFSTRERRRFQDPLTAIKFAADHFPFRAGTRKVLAVFACEECGGTEVDYLDLQSELLQTAVGLQLFTTQKIELSTPSAPEIIALDANTMYATDISEKPELRPQLVEPHDSCTVLTQETNGTVFSYSEKNLQALVHLLSRKMVLAVNVPKCQMCECQEHERTPRTTCFPCEIPRPASLTSDSTGFFNNPFVRLQKWQKKAQDTINRGLTPALRMRF